MHVILDVSASLRNTAEQCWSRWSPTYPGLTIEVVEETASTNADLMKRPALGDCAPVIRVALRQLSGRGRRGRAWQSSPGATLTLSLGLPLLFREDFPTLSLAVGTAIAESLHPEVRLKWPNDLYLPRANDAGAEAAWGKLGGILIESTALPRDHAQTGSHRWVVVGVGLNISQIPEIPPSHQQTAPLPAAMLRQIWPSADLHMAFERVGLALLQATQQFEQLGWLSFASRFVSLDLLHGQPIWVHSEETSAWTGIAQGIDERGQLRVMAADRLHLLSSAEVSVRSC